MRGNAPAFKPTSASADLRREERFRGKMNTSWQDMVDAFGEDLLVGRAARR